MKRILALSLVALLGGAFTAMASGGWDGNWSINLKGTKAFFLKTPARRHFSDTTQLEIKQNKHVLTCTLHTFANSWATAVFKGKEGNGMFCVTRIPAEAAQPAVMWGVKRKDGTIRGTFMYPRVTGSAMPGYTYAQFTARRTKATQMIKTLNTSLLKTRFTAIQGHKIKKGIDPAAVALSFKIVRRNSAYRGRIRVTAVVENVGDQAYIDPRRAGAIHLYEAVHGAHLTADKLVRNVHLRNLKPGESQTVTYERNWNSSSPNEGEFPPEYTLLITYDPDITMDGCPTNDDCNPRNNKLVKPGSKINDIFHRTNRRSRRAR